MAILKCKMCGGDLDILPDSTVATCQFCSSVQTVPSVDDEKKSLFLQGLTDFVLPVNLTKHFPYMNP